MPLDRRDEPACPVARRVLRSLPAAMAAGVADRLWTMGGRAEMVEAGWPKPAKRGPYKKLAVTK